MTEHGEQDKAELRLTDEQLAELKRRLADPNPKFLALEEVRERFARRRAWQAKEISKNNCYYFAGRGCTV